MLAVPSAAFGNGAPQHDQLCSTSASLSNVWPAVLPGYCCMNKPKFHLKNCSYIHSTSKGKVVAREASKLQIYYCLADLNREPEEKQTSLWVFHTPWKDCCLPSLRGKYFWVVIFSHLTFLQLVIALHGDEVCVCV